MAIIIVGKSKCPICNKILQDVEDSTSFTAFIGNTKDELYIFNDAGLHTACLLNHPNGTRALELAEECHAAFMKKKCIVTGETITDYREHFFLALLTSDVTEPLYRYNFITLNRKNIPAWKDREDFINTAEKFIAERKWANLTEGFDFWGSIMKLMKQG